MTQSNHKRTRTGTKRLLLTVAVAAFFGAVAALVSSTTFGLFSTNASSTSSSFTTGTVTQTRSAHSDCGVSNLLPDGTANNCGSLQITYTGSVNAYLGLDVLIETQAGSGGTTLYNPTDGLNDLQVTVTSGSGAVTYTEPTTSTACPGGAPANSTCYELDNELVSTTPFTSGNSVTFATSVTVPTSSTTDYQGGAAQILLTAHAVQSGNNLATGCTAGHVCSAVTWS